ALQRLGLQVGDEAEVISSIGEEVPLAEGLNVPPPGVPLGRGLVEVERPGLAPLFLEVVLAVALHPLDDAEDAQAARARGPEQLGLSGKPAVLADLGAGGVVVGLGHGSVSAPGRPGGGGAAPGGRVADAVHPGLVIQLAEEVLERGNEAAEVLADVP